MLGATAAEEIPANLGRYLDFCKRTARTRRNADNSRRNEIEADQPKIFPLQLAHSLLS